MANNLYYCARRENRLAYTGCVQCFYGNIKIDINADEPSWENFKTILKGVAAYE